MVNITLTENVTGFENKTTEFKGNFDIITQNAKGLRDKTKRKTVFEHLKKLGGIILLQETHGTKNIETQWKNEWDGDIIFSHGASNSRGVMILFPSDIDVTINKVDTDTEGRMILMTCTIQDTKYLLYNVYGPNSKKEHKLFLENLKNKFNEVNVDDYEYIIGGGDWNFTDTDIDRLGGNYTVWQESSTIMEEIAEKNDIIDIWRVRNPDTKRFTFRQKNKGNIIQSRLDRLYISDTLQYNVSRTDIFPSVRSDHSGVKVSIRPIDGNHQNGSSFWKFNNSLLKNEEFTTGLKSYIKVELRNDCNDISSKQVKWEFTKFKIKTWCIKMSKKIAAERRKDEKHLESQINILENKLSEEPTENLYDQLNETKTRLEKIHEQKIQSLIIQSRIQHYEDGEKSTKFFLNQIKQNKKKATIQKLIIGENVKTDQNGIMKELKTYYSNLYAEKATSNTNNWIKNLKQSELIPQLSPEKNEILKKTSKLSILKIF